MYDNNKEIAVVGIGGCGETTLARMLFDQGKSLIHPREDYRFWRKSTEIETERRCLRHSYDYIIWINLGGIMKGDQIDFKQILKAMLMQCYRQRYRLGLADDDDDQVLDKELEEGPLLNALKQALWWKSFIIVFDGVWDINLHWYFSLKQKLLQHEPQLRRGESSRLQLDFSLWRKRAEYLGIHLERGGYAT